MIRRNIWLGQVPVQNMLGNRRLAQAAPSCPEMTEADFKAAADSIKEAWETSGKNTLVGTCAIVGGRIKQECRFPDGYASAQNVGAAEGAPPSCEVLWSQRQSGAGMSGRRTYRIAQSATTPTAKVLTDQTLSEALAAPKAVLMLYSPNCPYSQKFMPIFQSLSGQYPDVLFGTINVLENHQSALKYNVSMLPTVVFLVNGQEVNRIDGVQEQGDFTAEMAKAFSGAAPVQTMAPTASAPPRAGTLVDEDEKAAVSPAVYVIGGVLGAGLLAALGYIAFGK